MTLVIRTIDPVTAPVPGSVAIAPLSVSGVLSRWHADYFTQAHGTAVTAFPDLAGPNSLGVSGTVDVTTDTVSGARAVKVAGSGALLSSSGITLPNQFTIGCRVHATENPGTVCYMLMTAASGTAVGVTLMSFGAYRAYGNGSAAVNTTANVTKPAWSTIVATFDGVNQLGKIALNGGAVVSGAQTWTSPTTTRQIKLTGAGTTSGIKFREAVILDHIAADAEMLALAADLTP